MVTAMIGWGLSLSWRRAAIAYGALAALLGAGCGGSVDPDAPPAATAEVVVSPRTSSLSVGAKLPLQAQAHDASGKIVTGAAIFWSSSDTTVATVSSAGVVTAKSLGTAQVSANAGGKFAIATITVVRVRVASVAVVPGSGTVTAGSSILLKAVTYDTNGTILSDRAVVWATNAPGVATVDDAGRVLGVAAGTATITATSEGHSGLATVTVNAAPSPPPAPAVDHIVLDQVSVTLSLHQSVDLTAHLYDKDGNELTGQTVTWTTSNPTRATVESTGATTAVIHAGKKTGTATITASVAGKTADVSVVVEGP